MTDLFYIDEAIRSARYELTLWTEEYAMSGPSGDKRSSMCKRDLQWLGKRITKLEEMRADLVSTVNKVTEEIRTRFK
jgi:hypothetical protein